MELFNYKIDSKFLCLSLVKAETEEEVISILEKAGYWDDPNSLLSLK